MKRYKSKHRRGTAGKLSWVGYDREGLLGFFKNVSDRKEEDPKNTEQTPNKQEDSKQ